MSTRGEVQVRAKKSKGSSRPPVSDRATEWWEQDAARYLNRRIEELSRTESRWRGIYFSTLLNRLYDEPSVVTKWRTSVTDYDKRHLQAFRKMCRLIAHSLPEGIEIFVQLDPKARPSKNRRSAAATDREKDKAPSHAEAHKRRYEQFLAIQRENPDATREACKAMWSERYQMSVPLLRHSIRFCERHEWRDGSRVEPELRYDDCRKVS